MDSDLALAVAKNAGKTVQLFCVKSEQLVRLRYLFIYFTINCVVQF